MTSLRPTLVFLGTMLVPSLVHATEPMIVSPVEGEIEAPVRERLEARLHDALRKSDLDLVELDAASAAAAGVCADDECRAALLDARDSHFLLIPIIGVDDQDYELGLTLYGSRGQQLALVQESCNLCGLAEAEDLLADLGARIGRKVEVAARAATLSVTSDPPGARVYLSNRWVGTTPFELPLEGGSHAVRIELDGYIGQSHSVDAAAGESQSLAFELQPAPPKPRTKLLNGLAWSALGLGLGTAAAGSVLIGIDERPIGSACSGDDVDALGHCRWRHATLEPGIALVAGGTVLLGTAVALLIIARKPHESGRTQARVQVRPSAGGITLRF